MTQVNLESLWDNLKIERDGETIRITLGENQEIDFSIFKEHGRTPAITVHNEAWGKRIEPLRI